MQQLELNLLAQLRAVSRYSIAIGILISVVFLALGGMPIGWQIALALAALTIGIPHGAVDHLITVPKLASFKMALFLAAYLGVVGLAIWGILGQNLLGFQLIVILSAIHFGIGDAAFVTELDSRLGRKPLPKLSYAFSAGFIPVMIPLVSEESSGALQQVNPSLIGWAGELTPYIYLSMIAIAVSSILWMLLRSRLDAAIDLALLLLIALIAPPLVAFAFYFGLWHALRHTGRLTLELDASQRSFSSGSGAAALWQAILAGLPALAIVIGFTVVLGFGMGFDLPSEILWYLLVVVWALTVPHMALTAKLDLRALRQ